jgi:hypothetical protein
MGMKPDQAVKKAFVIFVVAAGIGTLGLFAVAARTPTSDDTGGLQSPDTARAYIENAERQWVQAVVTGDTGVVERTLAEDFLGVGPDGKTFDKSVMMDLIRSAPQEYVSNRLNDVTVRFYGRTAVATGSESWERRTQEPRKGRFVWTDTWMLKDGQWQVVAGSDFELPE